MIALACSAASICVLELEHSVVSDSSHHCRQIVVCLDEYLKGNVTINFEEKTYASE